MSLGIFFNLFLNLLILERERKEGGRGREKEKEKDIDLLFQLFMHSLVASCMCPDQGSNP